MKKTVHVGISNVYKNPTYKSEITNQALLGETVEILKTENDFDFVKQSDGYEGWIKNNQLSKINENNYPKKTVISHVIRIFKDMDPNTEPVRDALIGCSLNIIDESGDWYQLLLPDGQKGWANKKHFGVFPEFNRSNVVQIANQFLGYPYFWGARSPRGFDCSGLVQTVFGLLGKMLPRDSFMQQKRAKYISKKIEDAQMGDLYFFGDDGVNVDHVGIALGNNKILHSRGMVRINSLNENDADFDKKLPATLISVSTVF